MAKKRIVINGVSGRMGREIQEILQTHNEAEFYAGVDSRNPIEKVKPDNDVVVIDFSTPSAATRAALWCSTHQVPLVSGTTGMSLDEQKNLWAIGEKVPVLWSPNMSLGINIFIEAIKSMGVALKSFDLKLEEAHHAQKKDAPSGTALLLKNEIEVATGQLLSDVLCVRGGGIPGIHKLWIMGEEETLTIEHSALNRKVFARGAIHAAIWLSQRCPGKYTMKDVLGS